MGTYLQKKHNLSRSCMVLKYFRFFFYCHKFSESTAPDLPVPFLPPRCHLCLPLSPLQPPTEFCGLVWAVVLCQVPPPAMEQESNHPRNTTWLRADRPLWHWQRCLKLWGNQERNAEHHLTGHFSDISGAPQPLQQVPLRFKQLLACIYIFSSISLSALSFSLLMGCCVSHSCP